LGTLLAATLPDSWSQDWKPLGLISCLTQT
jgi:hypothetical protein